MTTGGAPSIRWAAERAPNGSVWQGRRTRFLENMTAFLKIDECKTCRRALPWEWIPSVLLRGKALAGTGVWHSQLTSGLCPGCLAHVEALRLKNERDIAQRRDLIQLLGGEKPYREFLFERYQVEPGNRLGFERCRNFNPASDSLFLWGPCGVGKTHLAYAAARRCFGQGHSMMVATPPQLSRKVRMKDPNQEQAAIDEIVSVEVLVLDDLGAGSDTAYGRQILQEILDGRDFQDRGGLLITSKYSLSSLAEKLNDDTLPSRLAGMCKVVEIKGIDHRVRGPLLLPPTPDDGGAAQSDQT
jgi:DNA replication protein DnaC